MKKKYVTPYVKEILLETRDIITLSSITGNEQIEDPEEGWM